jgi:3-oxoacyl-[acyl-carrier-protein] synthase I
VSPLVLTSFTGVNALGRGVAAILAALRERRSGLTRCTFENAHVETWCGVVPDLDAPITGKLADYDGRNNRLALAGLRADAFEQTVAAARERYGGARIGVIVGTSTSGILETEHAYRRRDPQTGKLPGDYHFRNTHNLFATVEFVRRALLLEGPAMCISTACSSSAKVFASAWRWMELGLCDAAVVGGVDSLCLNTLYGFGSLELLSPEPCRPCAADRKGISIGEAAGFALLERPERATSHSGVALLGYGESSDAYHMSTPHPEGTGAALSMERALASAQLAPAQIDYINLHGTASLVNDTMEDKAIARVFGTRTPASSTKGWTGHALGAAGITEAVISALCIRHGFMPGNLNTTTLDPALTSRMLLDNVDQKIGRVLSNSFGFGGSNASLVFGAFA